MAKTSLILAFALFATVAADPYVISPFYTSPYAAAYTSAYPAAYTAAYTAPVAATVAATVPAAPALPATFPVSSVSAYSYGSAYSVQELPVVSAQAAPLVYSAPYTSGWPYAYAADYYYRK